MVSLELYRARIGSFHCTVCSAGRKLRTDAAKWHGESSETVNGESGNGAGVTVSTCIIVYLCVSTFIILTVCLKENVVAALSKNCIDGMSTVSSFGTDVSGEKDITGFQTFSAMHVPVAVALCLITLTLAQIRFLRLMLCGDIEQNPGPTDHQDVTMDNTASGGMNNDVGKEILAAIKQQQEKQTLLLNEQTEKIMLDLSVIKTDLASVNEKCTHISQRCDRLEQEHGKLSSIIMDMCNDFSDFKAQTTQRIDELYASGEGMRDELCGIHKDLDRLEGFSRRENLRLYGIPHSDENGKEDYDECAKIVVQTLNSVDERKEWKVSDVVRAHRVGRGNPRPMIAKFREWGDKMALLRDRNLRGKLRVKGVNIANDLTRRQAQIAADAKREGKVAYFEKGEMKVGPKRPDPRSYAEVTSSGGRVARATDELISALGNCPPDVGQGKEKECGVTQNHNVTHTQDSFPNSDISFPNPGRVGGRGGHATVACVTAGQLGRRGSGKGVSPQRVSGSKVHGQPSQGTVRGGGSDGGLSRGVQQTMTGFVQDKGNNPRSERTLRSGTVNK